ncbi:SDR family NAD(P)-dependent oxidoreductase [Paraburkholderia tropica]|uniref:NAD(P)-dependent dehydrogenase (Short-subunit alcohol dehydrogenase family) n=1 Tax=Paraburkholderia tropica TaxID=92647 RepID=A0ABX5MTW9_9BURK|nr:SDR family oxidoreductase [Paraburkholderia tropica]PXX18681.1 NAD(P)-dependent dehydrogenase (short-subunit alcohol dehydrogenase family) [Paraburkholderia tropica]PZW87213.1 NAD(P)-dependent dehydrogenase (short-subunit alcohol dehydrogenase family) [Paraburkholderia tropica]
MKIDLSGKLALVTGSAAGIGLATAKGLAESGASVIVSSRHAGNVSEAEAAVRAAVPGAQVQGFVGDLSNAQGCEALVKAHPKVDILVNNLGVFQQQDFFEIPDSEWLRFFEINVMSGVRLSRAYAGAMAKQGWGRIVFISSESGLNIPADMVHYGMTKTAQLAVARGLAKRLAGTGVTVNSVLPGPTLSEGVEAMLKDEVAKTGKPVEEVAAAFVQQHRASSIIRRAASVEEVANMVVYACSTQASATTGAALRVDGGVVDTIA